jgi:hypothetical protein
MARRIDLPFFQNRPLDGFAKWRLSMAKNLKKWRKISRFSIANISANKRFKKRGEMSLEGGKIFHSEKLDVF